MAEEQNQNPYMAVLADLERDRDQINAMIAMIRKRAGLSGDDASATPATGGNQGQQTSAEGIELRSDTFFGMVISDAIRKYLNIVKRPKKTAEIARALEAGGMQHMSKRWFATVQTTLVRMHGVVRLPNGWGMLEWYPGRNFDKKTPVPKKKKRTRATKPAKAAGPGGAIEPSDAVKSGQELADSRVLQGRYLGMLKKVPADKRDEYKAMAKKDGREKAIRAMARDLSG
jgi:hypothetical protein